MIPTVVKINCNIENVNRCDLLPAFLLFYGSKWKDSVSFRSVSTLQENIMSKSGGRLHQEGLIYNSIVANALSKRTWEK